ncbi:hypothetical protein [Burkholderia seminalis]|uniref:hypothetical protein n=1 Tax=Burkholderia seminalis TaxID=488731 RepID=UPI00299D01E2|nr:hypothetical protein [Burkholderia seminalis]
MENKMAIPQKLAIAIATLGMVSAAAIAGTPAASDSAAHDAHHPNKSNRKSAEQVETRRGRPNAGHARHARKDDEREDA